MFTNKKFQQEILQGVEIGKCFLLYEIRNEWVDWNGTTVRMARRGWRVHLALSNAEQAAEKSRLQGTKFEIREWPIVCFRGTSGVLVATEVQSRRPLAALARNRQTSLKGNTLGVVLNWIPDDRGVISDFISGCPPIVNLDGVYYSRKSSPGRGKNSLGWTLKPQEVDDSAIQAIAADGGRFLAIAGDTKNCTPQTSGRKRQGRSCRRS